MKLYEVAIFLSIYSYQFYAADSSLSSAKSLSLKAQLDCVKKSQQEHFRLHCVFSQPTKFPIKPDYERDLCKKLVDTNRVMHEQSIRFIHAVFELKSLESLDIRLLTPGCVVFCMKELQKKPHTPRSKALVEEFFEIKKPWVEMQKAYKQLVAGEDLATCFDDEASDFR